MMRESASYSVSGNQVKVHVLPQLGDDSFEGMFQVDPPWEEPFPLDVLDPVLLEVLASGSLLVTAPGVLELERIISAESLQPPSPSKC
jgi:hypothetical protein